MMWKLPAQDVNDAEAHLTTALTYANGQPIYALTPIERAAILSVYQLYDAILGQPHHDLQPATLNNCRAAMHNAYNQVQLNGRLESLRSHILASTDACPFCGFGEPTELDHYLPRSIYGELAIYPSNLIPSCGPCNNAKRAIVPGLGPANGPGLIHPYFQELPTTEFLKANVTFGEALDVTFAIDATDLAPDLATKLGFQLTRLKLNERYPRQINKFLSEQRTGILLFMNNAAALALFLQKTAISLAESFGLNDWRAALVRALSNNVEFCANPERYVGQKHALAEAEAAP